MSGSSPPSSGPDPDLVVASVNRTLRRTAQLLQNSKKLLDSIEDRRTKFPVGTMPASHRKPSPKPKE